jgi:hypothetical protein
MRWDSPSPAPQRAPAGPAVVALPGGNTVRGNGTVRSQLPAPDATLEAYHRATQIVCMRLAGL